MKHKVAVVECRDYCENNVKEKLDRLLELLNYDMTKLSGKPILIKPNLLKAAYPEDAVTTHPSIVSAIAVKAKSCYLEACIGDSPGYGNSLENVKEMTGMALVSEKTGMELLDLGLTETYSFDICDSVGTLPFTKYIKNCHVISVPKIKISRGVLLTCGVKNTFGCVAGEAKERLHRFSRNAETFYRALNLICKEINPKLTIADGVYIMEGNGPDAGKPFFLGLLFAGENPFAVDRVVAAALGLNPEAIGTLRFDTDSGIKSLEDIEILGVQLSDIIDFQPELPRILSGKFHAWGNPRIAK